MAIRFRYRSSVEPAIKASGPMQAEMKKRAEKIANGTRANAKMSGYGDSLTVVTDAQGARVTTDWPFAHLDEWGSVNNPASGAMRRAAEEQGRFEEKGR